MDISERNMPIGFGDTSGISRGCRLECNYINVAERQVENAPQVLYGDEVDSATISDLSCKGDEVRDQLISVGRCLIAPKRSCKLRGIVRLFDADGQRIDEFDFNAEEAA